MIKSLKREVLVACLALSITCQFVQESVAQNFAWASKIAEPRVGSLNEESWARGVVADASGNSVIVGEYFSFNIQTCNTSASPSYAGPDGFVTKCDASGTVLWKNEIGGTGYDMATDVAIDGQGNIYVTGKFTCKAIFGSKNGNTIVKTTTKAEELYIAKYDPNGNLLWVITPDGGTANAMGMAIAVNSTGIYITGLLSSGTINFGTVSLTASSNSTFIAKYTTAGVPVWAQKVEETASKDIAVDASGNTYITGSLRTGTTDFGGTAGIITSSGSFTAFTAKFNINGAASWAKTVSTARSSNIALDGTGNCYVVGSFTGTATFSATYAPLISTGGVDIFIGKYSNAGDVVWAIKAGGIKDDYGYGIRVDNIGNSYITGSFIGPATIGGKNLTSTGNDLFVAKYNSTGTGVWAAEALSNNSYPGGNVIDLYDTDNVIVAGDFSGTATLGSSTLTSTNTHAYVAKLVPQNIITSNPSVTAFCAGATISVPYTKSGTFNTGNTFKVQLSNAAGSFANPVTLTTLSSTATSITARIPATAVAGIGYRVRVVASNPYFLGSVNTTNLTINANFTVYLASTDPAPEENVIYTCAGSPVTLTVGSSSPTPLTYTWSSTGPGLSATTGATVTFTSASANDIPYLITVSGSNGTCSKNVSQQISVYDCAGGRRASAAKENGYANYSIAPNPATESFTLHTFSSAEEVLIQIVDVQGRIRKEVRGQGNTHEVAVKDLASGLYMVKIKQGNILTNKKIHVIK